MSWLVHLLGLDDPGGRPYAFWSGFGSDLGYLAFAGGLAAWLRKHNCHQHHCWRLGRHPLDGTGIYLCRKHHPTNGYGGTR